MDVARIELAGVAAYFEGCAHLPPGHALKRDHLLARDRAPDARRNPSSTSRWAAWFLAIASRTNLTLSATASPRRAWIGRLHALKLVDGVAKEPNPALEIGEGNGARLRHSASASATRCRSLSSRAANASASRSRCHRSSIPP